MSSIDPRFPLALAALAMAWGLHAQALSHRPATEPVLRFAVSETVSTVAGLREADGGHLPILPGKPAAHASTIVSAGDGRGGRELVAFWFSGERESAHDVEILTSRYARLPAAGSATTGEAAGAGAAVSGTADTGDGRGWTPSASVVDRHSLGAALGFGVRRIGNPVAWSDADGRVHLFVVATGLGGWAASRIAHLVSDDDGRSFRANRILPLSPLFNTSMLVRGAPVPMADGGMLLPIYFELGNKYPVALRLDAAGRPLEVTRLATGLAFAQPSIVATGPESAIALLRDCGPSRLLRIVRTDDGGRSWKPMQTLDQPNPDSSIVAVRLPDGTLAAVGNPLASGRHSLAILKSVDGHQWKVWHEVEHGEPGDEFSYPSLQLVDRVLHLTYTWQRKNIRHRSFKLEASL